MPLHDKTRRVAVLGYFRRAYTNGLVYTLVLSAQRNQLDVYEYLKYLLSELPNIGDASQSKLELLSQYMS